jgi:hypothetical protein
LPKFVWEKHAPQASPFAIVAGNPSEYVVYTLSVPGVEEAQIQAAVAESVAQMCRLAPANAGRAEIVLFEWDSVYSTLTVVYTDRARTFDAREVLKVFVPDWDAETRELGEDESLAVWEEREGLIRTWLRRALNAPDALPEVRTSVAALAARGVVPVYSPIMDGSEFEPL